MSPPDSKIVREGKGRFGRPSWIFVICSVIVVLLILAAGIWG